MRKRIVIGLLIVAALLVVLPPMYAMAIADPDNPPQINAVYVYNGLLEDDDCGILIDYYLEYAALPTEVVTEAYLVSFIDTDGTTQLSTIAPYAYNDKGYGRGIAWIYFSAAEVASYSIDSASIALYEVWLMGNPTVPSGWVGDPPKTTAGIDYWQPDGTSTATLLALRILYLADQLELAWTVDMVEETSLGSRLTTAGESYFTASINGLRTMAPACFSAGEYGQVQEDLDYSTEFGATMEDGTGTVVGSPITLAEGANTVNVTVAGTFTLELTKGTQGTAASVGGGGTVTGSPVTLRWGTNTITVPGGGTGNILITVNLVDTSTDLEDTVTGTGFDLTTLATRFGMTRWTFSGLVWFGITILICAATYGVSIWRTERSYTPTSGKGVLLVFDVCIIGGALLGLVHPLVATMMFIGFGIFTAYVLHYRGASF